MARVGIICKALAMVSLNSNNLSNDSRCENFTDLIDMRQVSSPHRFHQGNVVRASGIDHGLCLMSVKRKWFLTEHWLACIESKNCIFCMEGVWSSDIDCVDIGIVNKLFITAISLTSRKFNRPIFGRLNIARTYGGDNVII